MLESGGDEVTQASSAMAAQGACQADCNMRNMKLVGEAATADPARMAQTSPALFIDSVVGTLSSAGQLGLNFNFSGPDGFGSATLITD